MSFPVIREEAICKFLREIDFIRQEPIHFFDKPSAPFHVRFERTIDVGGVEVLKGIYGDTLLECIEKAAKIWGYL